MGFKGSGEIQILQGPLFPVPARCWANGHSDRRRLSGLVRRRLTLRCWGAKAGVNMQDTCADWPGGALRAASEVSERFVNIGRSRVCAT